MKYLTLLVLFLTLISNVLAQAPDRRAPPQRSITDLGDGLYQVNTGAGVSPVFVFLVTEAGILIVDPPNPATAQWLQEQLSTRFPGQDVVYVVESHYHWDHTRGSTTFADTATFVGHENMLKNLDASIAEAPPPGNTRDSNNDGLLSREEAQTGTLANFDAMDNNGDDYLTQAELTADTARPDIVFSDRLELNFGGKRVVLLWSQNRHTNDLIDVYFPDHGVLLASDYVWINRMCCNFQFDERPMSVWIESIRDLETLDFDILINSHFDSGNKQDLIAFRRWLEDLANAVSTGIAESLSLEAIQASVELEQYTDWAGYENQLNNIIASAYNSLMLR
ncbi:MBL fold metallo-hydrolase [Gammaproteobacteria bacterium]|nr:MBL fold metallo-hydrolase [Gammaproteobacteria bacterium]